MKVKDTFKYFCDMCWVFFTIMSACWAVFLIVTIAIAIVSGFSIGLLVIAAVTVFYGLMLFAVSYWEAHTHWKKGDA